MQSRRNLSAKWLPVWPARWRLPTCWAPANASVSASSAGERGKQILLEAVGCDNVECVGAADVYAKRFDEARGIAPGAKTYLDYRPCWTTRA